MTLNAKKLANASAKMQRMTYSKYEVRKMTLVKMTLAKKTLGKMTLEKWRE